jgi:hypothetical protein
MKRKISLILPLFLLALPAPSQAQAAPRPQEHVAAPETPAPLPDILTLLRKVEIARQQNAVLMENYFFDATTTTHDASGKTDVKVAEISYIHGVRLERLIAHNGKDLPPGDEAKEKERSDKAVAKAKERVAKAESKGEVTDSNGDTLITLDRLLELFTISNPRREMLRGRSAIAFDFTGNRSVKTKSVPEAILRSFSGTVWIDEKDSEIAKLSGTIADGYKLGFGMIINISKGTGGTVEFAPVNGEVWLPARLDGQGHARLLLVDDALDGTESTVFSNFHKFQTGVKLLPDNEPEGTGGEQPATQTSPQTPAKP